MHSYEKPTLFRDPGRDVDDRNAESTGASIGHGSDLFRHPSHGGGTHQRPMTRPRLLARTFPGMAATGHRATPYYGATPPRHGGVSRGGYVATMRHGKKSQSGYPSLYKIPTRQTPPKADPKPRCALNFPLLTAYTALPHRAFPRARAARRRGSGAQNGTLTNLSIPALSWLVRFPFV